MTDKPVPDFAIFQNSRTRMTGLWAKEKGEWISARDDEYEILSFLAQLIRTTPNPQEVLDGIKIASLNDLHENDTDSSITDDEQPPWSSPTE